MSLFHRLGTSLLQQTVPVNFKAHMAAILLTEPACCSVMATEHHHKNVICVHRHQAALLTTCSAWSLIM